MKSVNLQIIMGNVGKDPEVRTFPSGDTIATFSVATTSVYKDKQTGEKKENTTWHNCVAYRGLAEVIRDYVKKGTGVHIMGELRKRKYKVKDSGEEREAVETVVNDISLLSSGKPATTSNERQQPVAATRPAPAAAPAAPAGYDESQDIPF